MQAKVSKVPRNPIEWDTLASKAIKLSDQIGDRRSLALKKAIQEGRSENILRSYGIISDTDLAREFQVRG
jgi:hypothetical protein